MKVEPIRTCIGCRRPTLKRWLVRLARRSDGRVIVDRSNRERGRGAYLCPTVECLTVALGRGALPRAFRAPARIGPEALEFLAPARERLLQRRSESASVSLGQRSLSLPGKGGGPKAREGDGTGAPQAGRGMNEVRGSWQAE